MNESIYDVLNNKTDREEKKKKLHSLLDKYNDDVEALEDVAGADAYEYMFAKPYLDEVLEERKAKRENTRKNNISKNDLRNIARDTLDNLNIGGTAGELLADTMIAKKYYDKMNETGRKLVNKYGRNIGAADGIDNYYHPLLQCELAKISPQSKKNGILLGYAKEYFMDYLTKRRTGKTHKEIMEDSEKDLKNNELGSKIGSDNLDKACELLLDYLRTENMKNEKIR